MTYDLVLRFDDRPVAEMARVVSLIRSLHGPGPGGVDLLADHGGLGKVVTRSLIEQTGVDIAPCKVIDRDPDAGTCKPAVTEPGPPGSIQATFPRGTCPEAVERAVKALETIPGATWVIDSQPRPRPRPAHCDIREHAEERLLVEIAKAAGSSNHERLKALTAALAEVRR